MFSDDEDSPHPPAHFITIFYCCLFVIFYRFQLLKLELLSYSKVHYSLLLHILYINILLILLKKLQSILKGHFPLGGNAGVYIGAKVVEGVLGALVVSKDAPVRFCQA